MPCRHPVVLETTLNVINSGEQSVFSRDASYETGGYFPRLRAGIVARLPCAGIAWARSSCITPA